MSQMAVKMYRCWVRSGERVCPFRFWDLPLMYILRHSPEGLDDVGGDGSSSLVRVGLPGQRDAVLGHVRDDGFVRRSRQLEGLCGLSD